MKNEYYVIITGGKNNAGDFLIKKRAKSLLKHLRPDRQIIEYNSWDNFDEKKIQVINDSECLILTGGPALVPKMNGKTYNFKDNLPKITVPISIFGLGWYSHKGSWESVENYKFSDQSLSLLNRVSSQTKFLSVRDYHSLEVLKRNNIENGLMTGCPALYDMDSMVKEFKSSGTKNITFSVGVTFSESEKTDKLQKQIILDLRENYPNSNITIAFHHSIDDNYLKTVNPRLKLFKKNRQMAKWCAENKFKVIDISGGIEKLEDLYSNTDLHLGYRVHAHIFCCSKNITSYLISEDGRGNALENVLPGSVFRGFENSFRENYLLLIMNKLFNLDLMKINKNLPKIIFSRIKSHENIDFQNFSSIRLLINKQFQVMKLYLNSLP